MVQSGYHFSGGSILATTSYFISDLHLSDDYPEGLSAFTRFLDEIAQPETDLFILGDFFDVWVGYDKESAAHRDILAKLNAANQKGLNIFFMPGNRDFLLNQSSCSELAMTAIPDPFVFQSGDNRILLMHGDSLCREDKNYLLYRKVIRNPLLAWLFRYLPMRIRRWVGRKMRGASQGYNAAKDAPLMDVTNEAVIGVLQTHKTKILIHGHTHKPGKHRIHTKEADYTRLVLGAWHEEARILKLDDTELIFLTIKL